MEMTRSPTRQKISSLVNQRGEDGYEKSIVSQVPPEIWTNIFKFAKPLEPKHLSKLRLVCKLWRDVIDENFEMKIKINDDKMEIQDIQRFKRITYCIVSKFVRNVAEQSAQNDILFNSSSNLPATLNIRDHITLQNLLIIADQYQNVTELTLTGFILEQEANTFKSATLHKLTVGLKKLLLTGIWIRVEDNLANNLISENFVDLMNCPMPNLIAITIRASYRASIDVDHFYALCRQCQGLESLELTLNNSNECLKFEPVPGFPIPTLTKLNIEFRSHDIIPTWLSFLKAQNSLKHLRLFVRPKNGFEFALDQQLQNTILQNKLSLEYLELGVIDFIKGITDDNFFEGMDKLKSLKLKGINDVRIKSLHLLPFSVEYLELDNVRFYQEEMAVIVNRIPNIVIR